MNKEKNLQADSFRIDAPHCDIFEPLISAMLDGELTQAEQVELIAHLDACSNCRAQVRAFQCVDQAVTTIGSVTSTSGQRSSVPAKTESATEILSRTTPLVTKRSNWSWWRMVPLAVAASLLLMFGITIINGPKPATADQVTPEQIVKPMRELHLINLQQQRDQELMLRTLGMDLRSLKFEIAQLESGSDEQKLLTEQVEAMIEKVRRFESKTE